MKDYKKVLVAIATKFNGLPDDFASPTERQIANILIKNGFLQIDTVSVKDSSYQEYTLVERP